MSASATIISDQPDKRTAIRYATLLFPIGLYIVGALVFFRWQIFSNFDLVFGGETYLYAFIHEHIFRWLHVHSGFLSPPFFFNQTNTLGYSDAFLLNQIIYAPLRLLGAEPLLALSLTAIVLSAVAYFFLYLFLRRLDVSVPLASLAALIFTFANNLFLKSWHFQHFAVYYTPVIAYCVLVAVSEVHRRPWRAYLFGASAAGLNGLLFSTGYYMAWFFGLALLIFTPIAGYIAWPQVRAWWRKGPTRVLGLGLVTTLGLVAALSIFAAIYAPVLALGFARSFGEYLNYAPRPIDIVNVGTDNLVWSGLIRSLHLIRDDRLDFNEVSIALTPLVQVLLLASAILASRPRFWPAGDIGRISRAVVIASATVCALFYLVTIKTHNFSLFYFLYAIVPGANAIRAGYRCMLVADLFAVTAIGLTFDRLVRLSLAEPRPLIRLGRFAALTVLLALAAIEQVNFAQLSRLSRKYALEQFSALVSAPRKCRSFYVARQPDRDLVDVQLDAMMIALDQHLPTINGYSSLSPPGWDLDDPEAADYEQMAERWALNHGIAEGLCRADIDEGTWTMVAMDRDWTCAHGGCVRRISLEQSHEFEINLKQGGNGASFTDDHWLKPEPGGAWTGATQAALSFAVDIPRDLVVALSIRALLSASAPKQSVWVEANRCRVGGIEFDIADGFGAQTITGAIPANCVDADGKVVLRIDTDRVRTPKEIGANEVDTRRLGLAVERVLIREPSLAQH